MRVLICTNTERRLPKSCGRRYDVRKAFRHLKKRLSASREANGRVDVTEIKCLRRCHDGPVLLLHPAKIWYTYHNEQDIDELVDEHVMRGRIVERLRLADEPRLMRREEPNEDRRPGAGRCRQFCGRLIAMRAKISRFIP
jgi:(2Fe-2S) ferredoxin